MEHFSVMLKETIDGLDIKDDGIYVDATLGRAGHSLQIVKKLKSGKLIAFDKDIEAINKSRIVLEDHLDKVIILESIYMS